MSLLSGAKQQTWTAIFQNGFQLPVWDEKDWYLGKTTLDDQTKCYYKVTSIYLSILSTGNYHFRNDVRVINGE